MAFRRSFFGALLLVVLSGQAAAADLATAKPESVGMSSQRLAKLTAGMKQLVDSKQLSGVVTMVAKDGKIVAEKYALGFDIHIGHQTHSAAKSFASTLAGIAAASRWSVQAARRASGTAVHRVRL